MRAAETLQACDVSVRFEGLTAIDGVSISLSRDEVLGLIGPNGAGKTTLVDVLTGLVHGTGHAEFRTQNLLTMKAHEIVRLGIGRTFQTATVFEQLSVLQNLDIAAGLHRKARTLLRTRRSGTIGAPSSSMSCSQSQYGPGSHL